MKICEYCARHYNTVELHHCKVDDLHIVIRSLRAQHKDLVNRNRLLRDRHDIPVDRLKAHAEMVELQGFAAQCKDFMEKL